MKRFSWVISSFLLSSFLLPLTAFFLSRNVEFELAQEVLAAGAQSTISADCTNPEPTAFVPDLAYAVTWSAPVPGSLSTPSASLTLTNPVNLDTTHAVTATLNGSGSPGGYVLLVNQAPKMKLGGIQCQSYSQVTLAANGDGADNTKFDVAIQNLADSDTSYNSAKQVDNVSSASPVTLWGAGGRIVGSPLVDGSDEDSATANGDVVWGSHIEANGGSEVHIILDVSNYAPSPGVDTETLTFTFTPS